MAFLIIKGRQPIAFHRCDFPPSSGLVSEYEVEKGEAIYKNVVSDELLEKCLAYIDTLPGVVTFFCGAKAAYVRPTT